MAKFVQYRFVLEENVEGFSIKGSHLELHGRQLKKANA
jgi:hypothetical protein